MTEVPKVILEIGSKPNHLRIGVVGTTPPDRPFFTLNITHLDDVREEPLWATALNPDQIGSFITNEIENTSEGRLYCVYLGASQKYEFGMGPIMDNLLSTQHFTIIDGNVSLVSDDVVEEKRRRQTELNFAPFYALKDKDAKSRPYEIVVFLCGVFIPHPTGTKGISIFPVNPGMSNEPIVNAVSDYLLERHNATLPSGDELKPLLNYNPTVAIDFHNVISDDEDSAIQFVSRYIYDISIILGAERGDRPYPILIFILDSETSDWKIHLTPFDFRGNLLPPTVPNAEIALIEDLHPILQSRPDVRLILELYVESLSERDRSFKFFRQWALLELIADKRIKSNASPLLNIDGSKIILSSGKSLTTERKEGKVYAYLRNGDMPPIFQGTNDGNIRVLESSKFGGDHGAGVITLWEAVAAAYKIRNEVAHDGKYDIKKPAKDDRDILCKEFFAGRYDFLSHAITYAVWREIRESNQDQI